VYTTEALIQWQKWSVEKHHSQCNQNIHGPSIYISESQDSDNQDQNSGLQHRDQDLSLTPRQ